MDLTAGSFGIEEIISGIRHHNGLDYGFNLSRNFLMELWPEGSILARTNTNPD